MQIAFYKGPATDSVHQLSHLSVTWWTRSPYSHVELVVDGYAYSSSGRDDGVRRKLIDFTDGKWDLFDLDKSFVDESYVKDFFFQTDSKKYDWAGVFRYPLPFLWNDPNRWYCSEWCSAGLRYQNNDVSPGKLFKLVQDKLTPCT
jgi:hypothetical protein